MIGSALCPMPESTKHCRYCEILIWTTHGDHPELCATAST